MARRFNVTGSCNPRVHYMVDIQEKLAEIKTLIDAGAYFTINRARQYGKTTTLDALVEYLKEDYIVISLDFQLIGNARFEEEYSFSKALVKYLLRVVNSRRNPVTGLDAAVMGEIAEATKEESFALDDLFLLLSGLCDTADKPVVLLIDEVDSATNNQVFLDFLAQLRGYYLKRDKIAAFQSVILTGVYDVKNIKRKIRSDEEHKANSPWNIATDFLVDMSFSKEGIEGMLKEYEADYHTGMDTERMAELIYDYTSGYPFLVSRFCQLIDERVAGSELFPDKETAWTREGFLEAEKLLVSEKNTLFESLINKLEDYPELCKMIYAILFSGRRFAFNPNDPLCELGVMFGFLKNNHGTVEITNRVFETLLYNYFISREQLTDTFFRAASSDKNQFIKNNMLDMDQVLRKFVAHFHDIYGNCDQDFVEEYGRKFFLLYLKPIINGTGNYYIEAQTRDAKRTDVIVDYLGRQFIVELKIWSGAKYHEEGEKQLAGYLERYHLQKGFLLTFCFNQKKEIGVKEIRYGDKILVEAMV